MYQKEFCKEDPIGRDAFLDIIDEYGLKVREKPRRKPKTTDSSHGLPVYPNLIRDIIPTAPNQIWVSDITYIIIYVNPTSYYFCYLSMIMDSYSKEIIGWNLAPGLDAKYATEALTMALTRIDGKSCTDLIHHSDRGCQYASIKYVDKLIEYGIGISMTENGDPLENPQAERINNTMKNELLRGKVFTCIEEAEESILRAVEFYNNERPHMSLNMMTPREASQCTGEIPKLWISYRERAIKNKAQSC